MLTEFRDRPVGDRGPGGPAGRVLRDEHGPGAAHVRGGRRRQTMKPPRSIRAPPRPRRAGAGGRDVRGVLHRVRPQGPRDDRHGHGRDGDGAARLRASSPAADADDAPRRWRRGRTSGRRRVPRGERDDGPGEPAAGARDGGHDEGVHLTAQRCSGRCRPGEFVDAMAFNGQVPGPQIRRSPGDQVKIVVENQLTSRPWSTSTG